MHDDIKPDDVRYNLKAKPIWLRFLYMLLFVIFWSVAEIVLTVVVIFQFIVSFSGKPNVRMQRFGRQLAEYVYAIIRFLTYNTEELPFPFAEWPAGDGIAGGSARRSGTRRKASGSKAGGGKTTDRPSDS